MAFAHWLETKGLPASIQQAVQSAKLPRNDDWPEQVTLSWFEPASRR
jgi:hypothetical protein